VFTLLLHGKGSGVAIRGLRRRRAASCPRYALFFQGKRLNALLTGFRGGVVVARAGTWRSVIPREPAAVDLLWLKMPEGGKPALRCCRFYIGVAYTTAG